MSRRARVVTRRILLVEDHRETAIVLSKILEGMGHEVRISGTLAGAIRACREGGIDVVFCDIGLPDGSGLDLPRAVKEACPGTTLIAITAQGYSNDAPEIRAAGFDALLPKPMTIDQMQRYLR